MVIVICSDCGIEIGLQKAIKTDSEYFCHDCARTHRRHADSLRDIANSLRAKITELEGERDGLNPKRFRDEIDACRFARKWFYIVCQQYQSLAPFCHVQTERSETDCHVASLFVKDVLTAQWVTVRDSSNFTILTMTHWAPKGEDDGK